MPIHLSSLTSSHPSLLGSSLFLELGLSPPQTLCCFFCLEYPVPKLSEWPASCHSARSSNVPSENKPHLITLSKVGCLPNLPGCRFTHCYNRLLHLMCVLSPFPGGASGKEPTCQCRIRKRREFDPWVGKIPWRRARQPTSLFLPEESHGQRSLASYIPRIARSWTQLKWLSRHICVLSNTSPDRCFQTVMLEKTLERSLGLQGDQTSQS